MITGLQFRGEQWFSGSPSSWACSRLSADFSIRDNGIDAARPKWRTIPFRYSTETRERSWRWSQSSFLVSLRRSAVARGSTVLVGLVNAEIAHTMITSLVCVITKIKADVKMKRHSATKSTTHDEVSRNARLFSLEQERRDFRRLFTTSFDLLSFVLSSFSLFHSFLHASTAKKKTIKNCHISIFFYWYTISTNFM